MRASSSVSIDMRVVEGGLWPQSAVDEMGLVIDYGDIWSREG